MTIVDRLRAKIASHFLRTSVLKREYRGSKTVLWGAAAVLAHGAEFSVSSSPPLFPAFDPSITDYVARCSDEPVQITVSERGPVRVWVDGRLARGNSAISVPLASGQRFRFAAWSPFRGLSSYSVRCLPDDFPQFAAERVSSPQAAFYVAAPSNTIDQSPIPAGTSRQYVAVFDNRGVPLWWMKAAGTTTPVDAKRLSNGNIAWLRAAGPESVGGGMEERRLDGTLARAFELPLDHHEIILMENGNYASGRYLSRTGVDLTDCGGAESATIVENEIYEIAPDGSIVWRWNAFDYIPVGEAEWPGVCSPTTSFHDVYHYNSIEPDSDGFVISFRHLNAVYKISRETGEVLWKLGGTPRPESLTVVGDPIVDSGGSLFGGQHDARRLPDGTWTVHDNRAGQPNAKPRALRFAIDEVERTATIIESVSDADVASAFCCGSSRKLPTGNWVMAWGANPNVTELDEDGALVFRINFTQNMFSYRADPIMPGAVSREALRSGMDAQYPRAEDAWRHWWR